MKHALFAASVAAAMLFTGQVLAAGCDDQAALAAGA
jgi:hypothetical protein